MGNNSSGLSDRLTKNIRDGSVFSELLAKSKTNLSIDLDPRNRIPDPFEQQFEIKWAKKLRTHLVILFPWYKEQDKKIIWTSGYSYASLQKEINKRLKEMPVMRGHEFGEDNVYFDRIVFCWGDYTYKLTGIKKEYSVYLIWSTQVKSVNKQSKKTTLFVRKEKEEKGVPVVVITNGCYRPISIFPIHPGEDEGGIRSKPKLIDPDKAKCNWNEFDLMVCDTRKPPPPIPDIKLRSELEVETTVNEMGVVGADNSEILEEDDPYFDGLGSDSTSDEDAVDLGVLGGQPPVEITNSQNLTTKLNIKTFGPGTSPYLEKKRKKKKDPKGKEEEEEIGTNLSLELSKKNWSFVKKKMMSADEIPKDEEGKPVIEFVDSTDGSETELSLIPTSPKETSVAVRNQPNIPAIKMPPAGTPKKKVV